MIFQSIPSLPHLSPARFILNAEEPDEYEFDDDSIMSASSTSSMTSSGVLKQSVRLTELGPRMRLTLLAVENGLYQGEYLYNIQSKEEMQDVQKQKAMERVLERKEVEEAKKEDEKKEASHKKEIEDKRELDREREKRKVEKKERKEKLEQEKKAKASAYKQKKRGKKN